MTLDALGSAVRKRQVSAVELVTMSLDRIERLDPPLKAVIRVCRDSALEEARALDVRIAAGEEVGPLAGLPLLVKDMEDVTGLPSTFGSSVFADAPPATRDALVPRRLRAAGAIVVGKTNQPEFAFAGYTTNTVYGTTLNPWGPDWSPGGSSGGSGAALAAGMAAIATATDGGGSIRIPAAFCGLAGFKPTNGVIARDPIPEWIDLSTCGPLATSLADVRLLLSLEAGPVPGDPSALPFLMPMRTGLPSRVFATTRFEDFGPLPPDVGARFDEALASIERDLGLSVERLEAGSIFSLERIDVDWFTICAFEHLHSLGRAFVQEQMDRFSPDFQDVMQHALKISVETYMKARRQRFQLVREMDLLLEEDAVLAMPTMGVAGLLADGRDPHGERPVHGGAIYNTDPLNLTGHPALSLPAGRCDNGIPFGLQITGPRFRDDLVLNVGDAWEAANPWPLAAPGFEPFAPELR